mgnify:CR=1 FL=1
MFDFFTIFAHYGAKIWLQQNDAPNFNCAVFSKPLCIERQHQWRIFLFPQIGSRDSVCAIQDDITDVLDRPPSPFLIIADKMVSGPVILNVGGKKWVNKLDTCSQMRSSKLEQWIGLNWWLQGTFFWGKIKIQNLSLSILCRRALSLIYTGGQ